MIITVNTENKKLCLYNIIVNKGIVKNVEMPYRSMDQRVEIMKSY